MLHRRPIPTSSVPSTSNPNNQYPTTGNSSPQQQQTKNKAFTPLRRQSSNLYGTPSSGPKARYNLPPPSPSYLGISNTNAGMYSPVGGGMYGGSAGGGGGGGIYNLSEGSGMGMENLKGGWKALTLPVMKQGLDNFRRGFGDAVRLERSWSLVWGDRELRTLVLKSTLINLVSLCLLSLFPVILSPLFASTTRTSISPDIAIRTKEISMWYNLLLSWPVFVVCFWINASWGPDISRRAQTLLHPTYRHQPSPSSTPLAATSHMIPTSSSSSSSSFTSNPISYLFSSLTRLLFISDFTFVTRLIALIPYFGRPTALTYMCFINAYYCFEWTFSSKQWPLDHRVRFMQERTAYMIGFGMTVTLLSAFGPPMVKMAIFALVYPFFVIQALHARPPVPRSSLLPSTPSPSAEQDGHNPFFTPGSSGGLGVGGPWKFELKVPIFFFARYALEGLIWLETAVGRDRGGSGNRGLRERAGKRLG